MLLFFQVPLFALPKNPVDYFVRYVHSNQPVLFWLYEKNDSDLATLLKNTNSTLEQIVRCNEIKDARDLRSRKYLFIPYEKNYLVWDSRKHAFTFAKKTWRTIDNIYYFTYYNGIQLYENSVVGGYLISGYGYRKDPLTKKYTYHFGWDVACINNTPVFINFDALIKETGYDRVRGRYIILAFGEYDFELHLYHLNKVLVKPKQVVNPGFLIALSGSTGKSAGPHLHLSILNKKKSANPAYYDSFVSCERKYVYKLYTVKNRWKREVIDEI